MSGRDRGRTYGELLVDHLAAHARANGVTLLRLETGIHQQAAIRLYERLGFRRIAPFGPYTDDPLSRCYEKSLALVSPGGSQGIEYLKARRRDSEPTAGD